MFRKDFSFFSIAKPKFEELLVKDIPELSGAKIQSLQNRHFPLKNILSIQITPKNGYLVIKTSDDFEFLFTLKDLSLVDSGKKRTTLLFKLHTGSFFPKFVEIYIYRPMGLSMLILLISGSFLLIKYYKLRIRKKNGF
jgi:hypothetical protein